MSYKNVPALPSNIEIVKRFDTREIDGSTSRLQLFPPNPSRDESQRNYVKNPFQGDYNHVVLDLSINLTSQIIKEDSAGNVLPVTIMNELKDSTVLVETNGGRTERILQPTSDYMNFSQTRSELAAAEDNTTSPAPLISRTLVTVEATGPRKVPDLFYLTKNESFTFDVVFNDGSNFPAASSYSPGRLALTAQFTLAQMSDESLASYRAKFQSANN